MASNFLNCLHVPHLDFPTTATLLAINYQVLTMVKNPLPYLPYINLYMCVLGKNPLQISLNDYSTIRYIIIGHSNICILQVSIFFSKLILYYWKKLALPFVYINLCTFSNLHVFYILTNNTQFLCAWIALQICQYHFCYMLHVYVFVHDIY